MDDENLCPSCLGEGRNDSGICQTCKGSGYRPFSEDGDDPWESLSRGDYSFR